MSDIKDVPVVSVDQALQGRIAGADIMATTGEPGATTSIRIRGTRSISASKRTADHRRRRPSTAFTT